MPKMDKNTVYSIALKHAKNIAGTYGIKPETIASHVVAIANVESSYNTTARNKKSTARGIMQMLICTQRENEKKRLKVEFAPAMFSCSKVYPTSTVAENQDRILNDPDYAIMLSVYELAYQTKRYKNDMTKAVTAYNQGSFPGGNKKEGAKYKDKVFASLGFVPGGNLASNEKTSSKLNFDSSTATYKEFY